MELKFSINRDEFLKFNVHTSLKKRNKTRLIIACVFTVIWLAILNIDRPFNIYTLLIELIIASLFWLIFFKITSYFLLRRIKKMPSKDGSILDEKLYHITEDGIKHKSETSESFIKWNGFIKYVETDDSFYLFVDKIAAYIFPFRVFDKESDISEFKTILADKIKNVD